AHVLGDKLLIANGWNSRIDLYSYDPATMRVQHVPGDSSDAEGRKQDRGTIWGFWVCGDVASDSEGNIVALNRNHGQVKVFAAGTHEELKTFGGDTLGKLRHPHALAINSKGQIAVADSDNDRVLVLSPDFAVPERPTLVEVTRDRATIEWTALKPGPPLVQYWPAPRVYGATAAAGAPATEPVRVEGEAEGRACRVELAGLQPQTPYHFRVSYPSVISLPRGGFSRDYAFATLAQPQRKAFVRLPVAVLVYANVYNSEGSQDHPAPGPIEPKDLDKIRQEIDKAVLFFWANSRMNLWVDTDVFVVHKALEPNERDRNRDLERILRVRGRQKRDYVGVVEITAERRYDPNRQRYYFQGSGGGTYGINYPEPGSSFFLAGGDVAWLFAHEYHHQVDSYYAESGYQEYPFNHFAPFEAGGFPGHFGEHWDGNAFILRSWTDQQCFYSLYGEVHTALDQDEDGIPDDNPALPLDEVRFGSDPTKRDTDDDGLDDLGEVLASNWALEMLPSTSNYRASYVRPDPTNPDSDGDGLKDGEDPYPIYAAPDKLRRAGPGGWDDLYTVRGEGELSDFEARIFAKWDDQSLSFAFDFSRPIPRFYIQTDFGNDGYYVGQDNYIVRINTPKGGPNLRDFLVNVCTTPNPDKPGALRWPHDDREIVDRETIKLGGGPQGEGYRVEVALPRHEQTGLTLKEGDTYGLAFYFLLEDGTDKWISAFEPYYLLDVTLAP
ncbi:MAG: fibronectin type III domain-containing protein, partial [Armatimonadota bacterium]